MIRSVPHTLSQSAPETPAGAGIPVLTLERLAQGGISDVAVIDGVDGAPALRRRLLEAGFTEGSPVRFAMPTPFGDPLVFSLRGASIALRKSEARCVRVRFETGA